MEQYRLGDIAIDSAEMEREIIELLDASSPDTDELAGLFDHE